MRRRSKLLEKFSGIHIPVKVKNLSPKEIEIRRRNEFYAYLDVLLSQTTFFDFFTKDSLKILYIAKKLAIYFLQKKIDEDLFLLAFFFYDSKMVSLLKQKGITEKLVLSHYMKKKNIKGFSTRTIIVRQISHFLNFIFYPIRMIKNFVLNKIGFRPQIRKVKMRTSYSLLRFFEKTAELALERYKTPAISEQILFLSLLEGEHGKFIREKLEAQSKDTWLIIRFKILKSIYDDEFPIKNIFKPNKYRYAYLVRKLLSRKQYEVVLDFKALEALTDLFRTEIIKHFLGNEPDYLKRIEKDMIISMGLRRNRKYSDSLTEVISSSTEVSIANNISENEKDPLLELLEPDFGIKKKE